MNIFKKIFGSKSSESSTTAVTYPLSNVNASVSYNDKFNVHFEDKIAIKDEWIRFVGIPTVHKEDGKFQYNSFKMYLKIPIEAQSETRHMLHSLVMENEAVKFDLTYELMNNKGDILDKFVLKDCYLIEVSEDDLHINDGLSSNLTLHEFGLRLKCSDICY